LELSRVSQKRLPGEQMTVSLFNTRLNCLTSGSDSIRLSIDSHMYSGRKSMETIRLFIHFNEDGNIYLQFVI
jgi:hypothetical protein